MLEASSFINAFSLAGFGVGVLVGLTGIGGGALMTPILILFFGISPLHAIGTDLLFAVITKLCGAAFYVRNGHVDWGVVRRMAAGSLPAAIAIGLFLNLGLIDKASVSPILMSALGIALVASSIGLFFKQWLHDRGRYFRLNNAPLFKSHQKHATIFFGGILGSMVTLTSVGAGALGAVIMSSLYPLRLDAKKLVGTDLIHAIPLALVAGAAYWISDSIDFGMLGSLLIGSIPAVALGSLVSDKAPEALLRRLVAIALLVSGLKTVGAV